MVKDIEEGCRTPKRSACRIPAAMVCPPPPKKKSAAYTARQRVPPKNGYFVPPDLELIFRDGFKLACKDLEVKKMAMGEESAMPRG
ncbi:hypothetical protein JHK82_038999 [Glycine max]|nr:hypothetical protein JHK86_039178 [Glycine max]KAG4964782.1 hypothetical protein JHK85_039757 [Glycine max]KAG5109776.1 hypothetical protein JHK82_038999 [Glycine max]KAG5121064.1 hypothetical protein JHK84_039404 [Glycine max]